MPSGDGCRPSARIAHCWKGKYGLSDGDTARAPKRSAMPPITSRAHVSSGFTRSSGCRCPQALKCGQCSAPACPTRTTDLAAEPDKPARAASSEFQWKPPRRISPCSARLAAIAPRSGGNMDDSTSHSFLLWKGRADESGALPPVRISGTSRSHARMRMKRFAVSIVCALILAGCQSSEPKNVAHQPPAATVAALPAPFAAPVQAASSSQVTVTPDPTLAPTDPAQAVPPSDTATAMALEYGTTCKTVGEVTMCDAPASADDTDYSN
jgi:hypothetical protein